MVQIKSYKSINCLVLALLIIFALLPLSTIDSASAAPSLTRKWAGYVAGGGEAILTADVRSDIPGEEIFHAGGPVAPNTGGRVTCLNGRTGQQIWSIQITNVGDTCQPHMTDMDQNGDLEIIIPLQQPAGVYILHAENGNVMFSATSLGGGRIDSSPVSGDVDNDEYPDLFMGVMGYEEVEPINGKVIRYEWDASTSRVVERDRVTVWHPCAGGLSLCDTDNDGRIELYMNERDVYFGDGSWGRGVISFWADTLDVRWQLYDWGASSNIPMLADVNRDGIVDVVTTDLSSGVCVLNSSNGQPLKNDAGTMLYQTRIAGRHNHYQSSVYDIDRDGNYEVLSGDGFEGDFDFITVFDLWDWKLDASIDTTKTGGRSWKGPTIGEVTGDGLMDIVVVCFDHINNADNGTLQVYDQNYNLIYANTGLVHRAIESVVQDVDRDDNGLNEILVLTQDGVIYCFNTPGLSEERQGRLRARSEVQFYSESRQGASEYLPYQRPITNPPPVDPNPPPNTAPTQSTPTLSGTTDSDNLVVTPQGTYDADGDKVTNIYDWQKNGLSLASINLPFETKTDPQDEYSGLAITRDYAYGASGSVYGATWTPEGKVGGGYVFDGNDFLRFEENANRYDGGGTWNAMSLECWVKVSSTTNERLILKTDRYEPRTIISYRLDCQNQGNQLLFTWNASGRGPLLYGLVTSNVNSWHHIVCTFQSGVGSRLYADGVLVNSSLSSGYTGNILDTDGPFEVAFGSGSDFIGSIDEVRLYPFAVSSSMIAQRYADARYGLSSSATINNADTSVGDVWRCQVTPNDGKADGNAANTVSRTIIAGGGSGYTLTVNSVGSGSVIKNPDYPLYTSGTVVNLIAVPSLGWVFVGWSGDISTTTNPTSITIQSDKVVTATFVESSTGHLFTDGFESGDLAAWAGQENTASITTSDQPYDGTYQLTCNLASGSNNGWSGAYKNIAEVNPIYLSAMLRLNAPPNTDNEDQWVLCLSQNTSGNALAYAGISQVSGILYWSVWYISTGNTLTYGISPSIYTSGWHNLQLAFYRGTGNNGWIEFYVDGALVFSAYNLDNDGRALNYARVGFSYSDAPSSAPSTLNVDNIVIDTSATPPPTQYTINVNIVGGGSVITDPNLASYNPGSIVTLTAIPAEGYTFAGWSGDLTGNANPAIISIDANKVVTATFTGSLPTHLFTDDFESSSLSTWTGLDGVTAVSTMAPYQGVYHLRSSLSFGANNGWAGAYKSISSVNPIYLSANINFNSPPNTDNEDQWVLAFTSTTAGNALAYAGVRQVNGNLYWTIWYLSTGTTLTYSVSSTTYTPGWHALQLAIYRGTANDGWVDFYVDGILVCSVDNLDNDGRNLAYARVGFSYSDAHATETSVVYVDNVTIDT